MKSEFSLNSDYYSGIKIEKYLPQQNKRVPRVNSMGVEEEQKVALVDAPDVASADQVAVAPDVLAPVVVYPVDDVVPAIADETEQEKKQRQYEEIEKDLDLLWGDN